MTNENDRKDENQLRLEARLEVRQGCAEPLLWGLTLFVSAMIPGWSELDMTKNLWPIAIVFTGVIGLIVAIPAFIIGLLLGRNLSHGWPNRAGLVVLCVGLWAYLQHVDHLGGRVLMWWGDAAIFAN